MATNINYQTSAFTLDTLAAKIATDLLVFQTDSTNNNTTIGTIPNGTSDGSAIQLFSTPSRTNTNSINFIQNSGTTAIDCNKNGTATPPKLIMRNNSGVVPRLCIGTNDKVGINIQDEVNGLNTYSLVVCTGSQLGAAISSVSAAATFRTGVDNGTSYSVNPESRGYCSIYSLRNANSGGGDEWSKQTWILAHNVDGAAVSWIGFQVDTNGTMRFQTTLSTSSYSFVNTSASFTGHGILFQCSTANGSGWTGTGVYSSTYTDVEFYARGDGEVRADGTLTSGGADYAEMFEWEDGNPTDEDRRGISVVLTTNGFIKPATQQDNVLDIIGVVSATPTMKGDDPLKWKDKYLRDDYGAEIRDADGHRIPNPEFDPEQEYVMRDKRKEWDCIGLVGKMFIRKGQPINSTWLLITQGVDTKPDLYLVR